MATAPTKEVRVVDAPDRARFEVPQEDHVEIARVASVVLERLSERQLHVVALHTRGLARRHIADHLGPSERVVKRSMEQILAIGRAELVRLAGHGCEAGEELVARSAFGVAGSREAQLAQLHLATCRRCGAMYERLDLWREKVAAVLPVPVAAGTQEQVVESVVHASTEVVPGSGTPTGESPVGVRRHAVEVVTQLFNISGATRIVQRVICMGGDGRRSCSARGTNYIRTYQAKVEVVDEEAPTATIAADTPLAAGAWVSGSQPLHYDAQDNVGVWLAQAVAGDRVGGYEQRPCTLATPEGAYANGVPCPNGAGQITVKTSELSEGTQPLVVQPHDTAGNVGTSAPTTVRIDNTAPARVGVAVDGGDAWRNRNDFVLRWTNAPENDRAPVAAAAYKLCPASNGGCTQSEQAADGIASLPVQVPGSGEWTVSIWRRDAAGNADQATASDPVMLRYDPEPPQLAFGAPSASDPTLVSAPVTDKVAGMAGGTIEISAAGSNTWQTLNTETKGSRLAARIDDAAMPAGSYLLRATAWDQAQNQAFTTQRADGQQMAVTLPLRIPSAVKVGIARERVVKRVVRRNGKRRTIRRRVTVLKPSGHVRLGRHAQIKGRIANRDGQGIAGVEVQVLASSGDGPEQLVGVVNADASGRFGYTATGSTSRTLRFPSPARR